MNCKWEHLERCQHNSSFSTDPTSPTTTMPFKLTPLLHSSIHEFAVLDDAAMRHTPTAIAMEREAQLKGTTRLSIIEGFSKWFERVGIGSPSRRDFLP